MIYPGLAQRMSAGRGIVHSERNDSATAPVHFVQMRVIPEETGLRPSCQRHEIDERLLHGALVTIASGLAAHDAAITLHNRNAALYGARLRRGAALTLPPSPYPHPFAARGRLTVEGIGELGPRDAVRFTDADGRRVSVRASRRSY